MTSTTKILIALLSCGASNIAWAEVPSNYTLQEGTVLSTHIPGTGVCPTTIWQFDIGPHATVQGRVDVSGSHIPWRLSGTYDQHGTFHLRDQELGGAERSGAVDAQVQSDGSLTMRIATSNDASPCGNRTIYLPWFRNGNDYDPAGGIELGF
jgi:hypothetical protein